MVGAQYVVPELLKDCIKKSGFKINFLADQIGVTYEGFRKKCNGDAPFRKLEVDTLASLLGMSDEVREQIFLPDKSTDCRP